MQIFIPNNITPTKDVALGIVLKFWVKYYFLSLNFTKSLFFVSKIKKKKKKSSFFIFEFCMNFFFQELKDKNMKEKKINNLGIKKRYCLKLMDKK